MRKNADSLFYFDARTKRRASVAEFFALLGESDTFCTVCKPANTLDAFVQVARSLVLDLPIVLVDSDSSEGEVAALVGGLQNFGKMSVPRADFDAARAAFLGGKMADFFPKKNWTLTLFTSGTTGRPKSATHTFESAFANIAQSPKHAGDVWAFAYNPTHFAGLQVFMQAFANANPLIDVFAADRAEIVGALNDFSITHISATPTFFRLLACGEAFVAESVERLTSGGEKFDAQTMRKISEFFPNAKLRNIYASTEYGSMLVSDGDVFEVKTPNLKVENGELFAATQSGGEKIWHATGDAVEVVCPAPLKIRFAGRKTEMINVGGYKVNPSEVEEALRSLGGVADARVYAVPNRVLGNIVGAEVVCGGLLAEAQIRQALAEKLQSFKVPRVIKFVNSIQKTRTGKIKR